MTEEGLPWIQESNKYSADHHGRIHLLDEIEYYFRGIEAQLSQHEHMKQRKSRKTAIHAVLGELERQYLDAVNYQENIRQLMKDVSEDATRRAFNLGEVDALAATK
jgi:hypothetical protein